MQEDIYKIIAEYCRLHLELNPSKSKFLLCSLDPRTPQLELNSWTIQDTAITRVESLRYLGVLVDRKLNFGANCEALCARSKRAIGALHRVLGKWTNRDTFCELYLRKVQPLLFYALPVSCPSQKQHWVAMEKVHRFAARLCTNDFSSSYEVLLQKLHWKPVSRLCFERQLLLMHRYYNHSRYLPENVLQIRPMGAYHLRRHVRHEHQLVINDEIFLNHGRHVPVREKNFPLHFATEIWNFIPAETIEMDFPMFKRKIQNAECFNLVESQQIRF